MKTRLVVFAALLLLAAQSQAQYLDRAWISMNAYEDMSDLMRRMPGMYPLDYGVAGAPVLFRPWGFAPWYLGVERDGIPWSRVSDGLYDSNLDLPDELDTLALRHDGTHPFATMQLKTRSLPTDTATTEVTLREGYFGFGRVDFTHAQRLNKRIEAEGRGRLWWYDGMRQLPGGNTFSRARFYNLSGKFRYDLGRSWRTKLEYGGANVDAQSPTLIDTFVRPQDYSEREYGTLQLGRYDSVGHVEFGLHARQDRVARDEYYRLREQFWYGYLEGQRSFRKSMLRARGYFQDSEFSFLGNGGTEATVGALLSGVYDFGGGQLSARVMGAEVLNDKSDDISTKASVSAIYATPDDVFFQVYLGGFTGQETTPDFWRKAVYEVENYPMLIDDALRPGMVYLGARLASTWPLNYDAKISSKRIGVLTRFGTSRAQFEWLSVSGTVAEYRSYSNEVYLSMGSKDWQGPNMNCDIALLPMLRLQSQTSIAVDIDEISRALDTRSYSRLLFTKDYFKAPLRITSYVAYEHIGKHRAASDFREEVIGPAHLVHFRVEAGIHGVTMVWGLENLTGQHYEYLPGYMLIRKEEYFGVKWTLKL